MLHCNKYDDSSDFPYGSKLISDYMLYLLAIHPFMLSVITVDIDFAHACSKIKSVLESEASVKQKRN